jgi:hypothetical protein
MPVFSVVPDVPADDRYNRRLSGPVALRLRPPEFCEHVPAEPQSRLRQPWLPERFFKYTLRGVRGFQSDTRICTFPAAQTCVKESGWAWRF